MKLDDGFPEHPRVRKVGLLGMALQVTALCYCARNLTDGYVPAAEVVHLTGMPLKQSKALVQQLVDAGMWEEGCDGFHLHDYLEYQPSRASVLDKRAKDSARKGSGRHAE